MNGFRPTVRGALDRVRRLGPSLGLAAVLLTSTLGAAVPAGASSLPRETVQSPARADGGDTAARIQINLISLTIVNDRDGTFRGSGELAMTTSFWRCSKMSGPCVTGDAPAALMAEWSKSFEADSGDFKALERIMPIAADVKESGFASEDAGLALHAGHRYMFQVSMYERDTVLKDYMGGIQVFLDESNQWGLGLHMQQPAMPFLDGSTVSGELCAGCGGVIPGDFLVTYEIVRTELPDLYPTSIRVANRAPGASDDEVCLGAFNSGLTDSGPFSMTLYVDGALKVDGGALVPGLAAHAPYETCVRTALPVNGLHELTLIVDEPHLVPEMNELNNALKKPLDRGPGSSPTAGPVINITGPGTTSSGAPDTKTDGPDTKNGAPAPAPSPAPAPANGQAQTDLTVSAIRVRGQVPDGKDDCKEGGNDVAVLIKNTGSANAGAFTVRLAVGGGQGDGTEQTVNGLQAGKEREVKFDDVKLKKGEQTLTAVADAKGAIAEANEENNERDVSARCKDN